MKGGRTTSTKIITTKIGSFSARGLSPHLNCGNQRNFLRGAIKIENQENLGQCPNRGGGKKNPEMSQFQFGNFENRGGVLYFSKVSQFQFGNFKNRGGGLYFSKMSQLQLFDSVFCNITFIRNI